MPVLTGTSRFPSSRSRGSVLGDVDRGEGMTERSDNVQAAEVCLPTKDLTADLAYYTDTLGFRRTQWSYEPCFDDLPVPDPVMA